MSPAGSPGDCRARTPKRTGRRRRGRPRARPPRPRSPDRRHPGEPRQAPAPDRTRSPVPTDRRPQGPAPAGHEGPIRSRTGRPSPTDRAVDRPRRRAWDQGEASRENLSGVTRMNAGGKPSAAGWIDRQERGPGVTARPTRRSTPVHTSIRGGSPAGSLPDEVGPDRDPGAEDAEPRAGAEDQERDVARDRADVDRQDPEEVE